VIQRLALVNMVTLKAPSRAPHFKVLQPISRLPDITHLETTTPTETLNMKQQKLDSVYWHKCTMLRYCNCRTYGVETVFVADFDEAHLNTRDCWERWWQEGGTLWCESQRDSARRPDTT